MLVYQWSATPRSGCWDDARRFVWQFMRFSGTALDWPAATLMVSGPACGQPSFLLEFAFDDGRHFEAAWDRLVSHEQTGEIWRELHPLLDEGSIQRTVYEIQYARAGTAER